MPPSPAMMLQLGASAVSIYIHTYTNVTDANRNDLDIAEENSIWLPQQFFDVGAKVKWCFYIIFKTF